MTGGRRGERPRGDWPPRHRAHAAPDGPGRRLGHCGPVQGAAVRPGAAPGSVGRDPRADGTVRDREPRSTSLESGGLLVLPANDPA
jgi:hypothetical protein